MKPFQKPQDIRAGLIGYGAAFNMGMHHINQMKAVNMTPVAVCDMDTTRRREAEKDCPGIETYADAGDMLSQSDINLAVIVVPHNLHKKLILQCLQAGRHVVCEKPLALTTRDCDRVIRESLKRDLCLSVYHNRHWDGHIIEAVRHVVKKRAIGDVVRVETGFGGYGKPGAWWRASKSISGGILYDMGVHLVEYALQIIRADVVEVSGFARDGFWAPKTTWKHDTNEDEATAVVRFSNGTLLNLRLSSIDSIPDPWLMRITGTRGAYVMRWEDYDLITWKKGRKVETTGKNGPDRHGDFYKNLAEHLVKGKPLAITPEWARRPVHVLDLACRSASLGRSLKARYA